MDASGITLGTGSITIGSEQHKELFCRSFIDTHDPYEGEVMVWQR